MVGIFYVVSPGLDKNTRSRSNTYLIYFNAKVLKGRSGRGIKVIENWLSEGVYCQFGTTCTLPAHCDPTVRTLVATG